MKNEANFISLIAIFLLHIQVQDKIMEKHKITITFEPVVVEIKLN